MSKLNIFVPITKVDAAKGIVYGVLAAEEKDLAGEVFDYAGSKPYFEKWSSAISKATNGASLGNLRAMHGLVAAGKFTDMVFNDDAKKIEVAAKVVDKNELEKVLEGVYTGFSIGGKYVSRNKDGDVFRYVADPYEGSLVDLPCIESATFEVVKADGAVLQKNFNPAGEVEAKARELAKAAGVDPDAEQKISDKIVRKAWTVYEAEAIEALAKLADETPVEPSNDDIAAKARELAKAAGDESKWIEQLEPARAALKGEKRQSASDDAVKKSDDEPWVQKWTHPELPGEAFDKKADLRAALAEKRAKSAAKPVTDALDALKGTLDLREKSISKLVAAAWSKGTLALWKAAGVNEDDARIADAFLAGHGAVPVVQALGKCSVKVSKDDGSVLEMPEATKTAILAVVDAARDEIAKRQFSDEERKKMAKEGTAMKDGSFPISTRSDLENAVRAFGRAKNKVAAKRHITQRAKALNATDLLPEDWAGSTKKDSEKALGGLDLKKVAKADLNKGASLRSVSYLVNLLADIECAEEALEMPDFGYGFMTTSLDVPKDLCDKFGALLVQFGDLVAEVLDYVLAAIKDEEGEEASEGMEVAVERAAAVSQLAKFASILPLIKAGARHSRLDQSRINNAHDLLVEAGAQCDGNDDAEKLAGDGDLRKLLQTERDVFAKTMGEITGVLKDVAARVKRIEEQPLPEGTTHVNTMEKNGEDLQTETRKFVNPNERAFAEIMGEMAGFAIRASQGQPQHGAPGNGYFNRPYR